MAKILPFSSSSTPRRPLRPVELEYSVRDVVRQFGIPEYQVRRLAKEGRVPFTENARGEIRFGFRALTAFRRIRELRHKGLPVREIEQEFEGQQDLFAGGGILLEFARPGGTFEDALLHFSRRLPGAAEKLHRAVDENDAPDDALCNLGILAFESGDGAGAARLFQQAIARNPHHVEAHYNLGVLFQALSRDDAARKHYETALSEEPLFADALFNLGLILAESQELEAARSCFTAYREVSGPSDDEETVSDLLSVLDNAIRFLSKKEKS